MSGSAGIGNTNWGGVPNTTGGIGGGAIGGGSIVFPALPNIPKAQFQIIDVSGGDTSFFPSSFVNFEKGIEEGEAALSLKRKSLGEVAQENRSAEKTKAKLEFTQDNAGNAVILRK